jgi:integrase
MSAGVAGTTPFRPTPSYTTLRDVTRDPEWAQEDHIDATRIEPSPSRWSSCGHWRQGRPPRPTQAADHLLRPVGPPRDRTATSVLMARVTGSILTVKRQSGDVLFLKARDRNGRQIKRRLGPAHAVRGAGPTGSWTRKQAEDALRDWLTDLGRMSDEPAESMTLDTAARAWLHYIEHERERAPSTVRDYRNTLNGRVVAYFGPDTPLHAIDGNAIDDFRRHLLEQVSRRTAQKVLVLLFGLLKYAKRRRWITSNPAEDAERVTVKRRTEFAVLSPEEVQALARNAADEQEAVLFTVAAFTGLRMGELRALRWRDVDFANRLVHVRRSLWRTAEGIPKSGKARSVPLIDQAAVALDGLSRRQHFTGQVDYVFANPAGGKLHDGDMRAGLYAALEAAGISRDRGTGKLFVFHDLRHTFGTIAVQAFALSDVQAYMGHADIDTTMLYVHHTPQHDAAERLSRLVAGHEPLLRTRSGSLA